VPTEAKGGSGKPSRTAGGTAQHRHEATPPFEAFSTTALALPTPLAAAEVGRAAGAVERVCRERREWFGEAEPNGWRYSPAPLRDDGAIRDFLNRDAGGAVAMTAARSRTRLHEVEARVLRGARRE
jgi:hypothetical protein